MFKFDGTINVPTLIAIAAAAMAAIGGYTTYREDKVKTEYKVAEHDRALESFAKALERQGAATQDLVGQVGKFSQSVDDLKDELRRK